jgi:hypothetical protein
VIFVPQNLFGISLATENEQLGGAGTLKFAVTIENIQEAKKYEKLADQFDKYYKKLYLDIVVEIHKYLIRLTPLHTGKLRGGWTALLDKYQRDYSKQISDTSLYNVFKTANITPDYKTYQFDSGAVQKGKAQSFLEDKMPSDTDISIDNQVEYRDYLDSGTSKIPARHFVESARYKGELWFNQYFDLWFKKMEAAGAIVVPPKVEEIGN